MISAIGSDVATWHPPPPSYETHGRTHSRVGLDSARWPQQGVLRLTNKTLQDLFGLTGRTLGLLQEEVFAAATVRHKELEAFLARHRSQLPKFTPG